MPVRGSRERSQSCQNRFATLSPSNFRHSCHLHLGCKIGERVVGGNGIVEYETGKAKKCEKKDGSLVIRELSGELAFSLENKNDLLLFIQLPSMKSGRIGTAVGAP